jgi:thiamine biosynthesis protein ThiI
MIVGGFGFMDTLYLIKYGEIALKGENKKYFFERLKKNLKLRFKKLPVRVEFKPGRFYVQAAQGYMEKAENAISHMFGITWYSKAVKAEKNMAAIETAAVSLVRPLLEKQKGTFFKIEVRRTDKSFPMDSYAVACSLGDTLRNEFKELIVNLKNPDWILRVEIRDAAFLYCEQEKGLGGLPVGSAGRGLLLLSGGIDSPVAGYLMAKRGLFLDAVYFHTPPYTSEDAKEKVKNLARLLFEYIYGLHLIVVPFTDVQLHIKKNAPPDEMTLHLRAAMMKCAGIIAEYRGAKSIVTGESLSQVASQTQESIRFTGSYTALPVLRPLIGFDKEEIIAIARNIKTFDISILPYPDCCTLFAPAHPLIRPEFEAMRTSFDALGLDPLIKQAAEGCSIEPLS